MSFQSTPVLDLIFLLCKLKDLASLEWLQGFTAYGLLLSWSLQGFPSKHFNLVRWGKKNLRSCWQQGMKELSQKSCSERRCSRNPVWKNEQQVRSCWGGGKPALGLRADAGAPGAAPRSLGSAHVLLGSRLGELCACFPEHHVFQVISRYSFFF